MRCSTRPTKLVRARGPRPARLPAAEGAGGTEPLQEALEIGLRALDESASRCRAEAGKPRMGNALVRMRLKMGRWSTERLLRLPQCKDRSVIGIQRILDELRSISYILRPNLFPLIVRKQLELTLANGHTLSSPTVFAELRVAAGDGGGSCR